METRDQVRDAKSPLSGDMLSGDILSFCNRLRFSSCIRSFLEPFLLEVVLFSSLFSLCVFLQGGKLFSFKSTIVHPSMFPKIAS